MSSTAFNPPTSWRARIAGRGETRGCTEDRQVRSLGGVSGCDGAFSNAQDLLAFGQMMLRQGALPSGKTFLSAESIQRMVSCQICHPDASDLIEDATTYLLFGPKSLGWELPWSRHCHGGHLISAKAYGKAGGVGSFLWIDPENQIVAILLTNYGFPYPFTTSAWNALVHDLAPHQFFDGIMEAIR